MGMIFFHWSKKERWVAVVLLTVLIVGLGMTGYFLVKMNKKLVKVNSLLSLHELIYHTQGMVNLSQTGFQSINDDLQVTVSEVTGHLNGIKVTGRILNTTSVRFETCEFKLTVNEQAQTFQIRAIPSGYASKFTVYVPNVPSDKATWGRLEYNGSQVSYYLY